MTFKVDGRYGRLRGVAGMSDDTNRFPPGHRMTPATVFAIHADGRVVWRSGNVIGAGSFERFDIDITGVGTITLTAESNTYSYMARSAWGDIELVE